MAATVLNQAIFRNVEGKTKKVTCSSSNTAKTGTLNWVELSSGCESYTLAAGVGDADTCGYSTALTFDMTTLSKNCTASCMSKSQCSETLVHNTTVEPSKYLVFGKYNSNIDSWGVGETLSSLYYYTILEHQGIFNDELLTHNHSCTIPSHVTSNILFRF